MIEDSEKIISQQTHSHGTAPSKGRIAMISTHGYVAAEPPLGLPDTGGQVVFVIELSKKLADLGYVVDIWTRRFDDQKETETVNESVTIRRVACGGPDFLPKEYLYKSIGEYVDSATQTIKAEKLEYEFINSHYWDAGIVGQALADSLKTPHVHTPHSLGSWKMQKMQEDFPDDQEKLEEVYNFSERIKHEQRIYEQCDALIATTPIQTDLFIADYRIPAEKITMIPPGYDDSRFYPISRSSREVIRERLGFSGKKVVTSLGRLSRNKGFDLLVEAFAETSKRDPDAYLFMALGTETERTTEDPMLDEIVEKIREYGLEHKVTIGSSLPDEAMADFYRASDVFCLPSRYEPFGMTAVEAMACGTPSVVTTNGGLYRTLTYGKEALYADSFDAADFGLSIAKLLKFESLRNRIGEGGARKARSLFTWTGIAQQLINATDFHTPKNTDSLA